MDRRDAVRLVAMMVAGAPLRGVWSNCPWIASTRHGPGEMPTRVRRLSAPKLLVQREEVQDACMRGYVFTQASDEARAEAICYVLELVPAGNVPYFSAIPAGTYKLHVREDGTRGWRLELEDVPFRPNVQIHLGNYPRDTEGCLLPGLGATANTCAVTNSAAAMQRLRDAFEAFDDDTQPEIAISDMSVGR
jgi:hypothetical protein